MGAAELAQPVLEAHLVLGPLAREEDEAVKHHAGAKDGDVFDGLLENDVQVTVHLGRVGYPPQVYPVSVYLARISNVLRHALWGMAHLVVGDEDHPLWKVAFQPAILGLPQLASDALVTADPHLDGGPPVCHGGAQHAKLLFGHGHPCVEVVLAVEI